MQYVRSVAALLLALGITPVNAGIAIVLNSGDATVSVIDTGSMKVTRTYRVGKEPHHLMATPDDKHLIVANAMSNELLFLDRTTGEIKNRITSISDPYQIGFSPNRKWFVSVSLRLHRTDIYEGATFNLVKRLATPKAPSHLIFNRDSTFVFVTLQDTNELAAIDLSKQEVAWKVPIGKQPSGIWMTPDDKHLLIGILGENFVEVIDWRARKQVKRIVTGDGAHNFIPAGDGRHVFLTNRVANKISKIDQQALSVVDELPGPGGPDCMDVTADGKQLWMTSRWIRKVTVVDIASKKIVKQIPVGRSPHGIYLYAHAARR
jgi:YVTN family beta-propeller protein